MFSPGQMAKYTKGITATTRRMDKGCLNGLMGGNTMEAGIMVSNMGPGAILIVLANERREFGSRASC